MTVQAKAAAAKAPAKGGGVPKPVSATEAALFIAAGSRKLRSATLPWKKPGVREDVMCQLNMKQPETLIEQLSWLAYETGRTKRGIVEAALRAYLTSEIKRLGVEL